jgi:hypothetical protein
LVARSGAAVESENQLRDDLNRKERKERKDFTASGRWFSLSALRCNGEQGRGEVPFKILSPVTRHMSPSKWLDLIGTSDQLIPACRRSPNQPNANQKG